VEEKGWARKTRAVRVNKSREAGGHEGKGNVHKAKKDTVGHKESDCWLVEHFFGGNPG
jgi:hypothetical protein